MQCAENAPTAILDLIRSDIRRSVFLDVAIMCTVDPDIGYSPQALRRLLAGHRLSLMSGLRFQMLLQNYSKAAR